MRSVFYKDLQHNAKCYSCFNFTSHKSRSPFSKTSSFLIKFNKKFKDTGNRCSDFAFSLVVENSYSLPLDTTSPTEYG